METGQGSRERAPPHWSPVAAVTRGLQEHGLHPFSHVEHELPLVGRSKRYSCPRCGSTRAQRPDSHGGPRHHGDQGWTRRAQGSSFPAPAALRRVGDHMLQLCRGAEAKGKAGREWHPRPHVQQPPRADPSLWTLQPATATAEPANQLKSSPDCPTFATPLMAQHRVYSGAQRLHF